MSSIESSISASELRKKYKHFRILVIGRANAGKTTLLKRVCNTDEDPCIYDEKNKALLDISPGRGIHDINRPFVFASNPQFIFHDSPGFEAGDESQLTKVQAFIKERARATDSPVIAILTKFDDLITQVYDTRLDYDKNHEIAEAEQKKMEDLLFSHKFPPMAGVYVEDMHNNNGNHQEQIKTLIEKTAESLDDLSLKMLFVSIQENNLELCMECAAKYVPFLGPDVKMWEVSCLSGGLR
ncbi:hypothetical protein DXG01_002377 [Tephrocybe rancida]|nr:hypothetical protein DXG01_002377 [Tephrocybe rancida]